MTNKKKVHGEKISNTKTSRRGCLGTLRGGVKGLPGGGNTLAYGKRKNLIPIKEKTGHVGGEGREKSISKRFRNKRGGKGRKILKLGVQQLPLAKKGVQQEGTEEFQKSRFSRKKKG